MKQRTREVIRLGIPLLRQSVNFRSGGIWQPHEFAGFVETFTRRVVHRRAEHAMFQFRFHPHEHRVPAADDERNVRLKGGEVGA